MTLAASDLGLLGRLAQALGLFGADGQPNPDWFAHPEDSLKNVLAAEPQRRALLAFIDEALGGSERTEIGGITWLPLIEVKDEPAFTLSLTVDERPADGLHVGVGLTVRTGTPASSTSLAVPLFRAEGRVTAAIADPTRLPNTWTAAERQFVSNRVLAKCDALDGVTDGLIGNYQACQRHFSLADDVPTCAGARDGTCLSPIQKDAIANIFSGARLSNGRPFYKSFPFDSGHGSANTLFWEFTASLNLDSGAVGFIFGTPPQAVAGFNGPNFTLTSDVDSLYRSIFAVNGTYTQSGMQFMTPPEPYELERFRRLGRKLVAYHGVSDAIFSVNDTVDWYRRFARGDDEDDDRRDRSAGARLFLIPGMNHCSGGPSTDQFDALSALVKWVEQGVAPERLTASARGPGNAGGVNAEVPTSWAASRTRPLCAYPKSPYYIGGDVERAESFACR